MALVMVEMMIVIALVVVLVVALVVAFGFVLGVAQIPTSRVCRVEPSKQ